jgi:hypothetical protein
MDSGPAMSTVKPFTHWVIYRRYSVRFHHRSAALITGTLTTPQGPVEFRYDPQQRLIHLPDAAITINQHGWEVEVKPHA